MKILIGIVVVLFLCVPAPGYAGDEAFCEDPNMWEYFDSMARQYPEDLSVQLLHALKLGLCEKVGKNTIRLEAAPVYWRIFIELSSRLNLCFRIRCPAL